MEVPDSEEPTLREAWRRTGLDVLSGLLEYRKAEKLLGSFIEKFPRHVHLATGRLHPRYR